MRLDRLALLVVLPLTAAACTLPQIRAMVGEMLEAEAAWLPMFAA